MIISIRQPFPPQLIQQMVEVHVNQSAGREGGKLTYFMEIVVINQSTWLTAFRSLNLRDIVFHIDIEQLSGFIIESLPSDFIRHFKFASRALMGPASGRLKYERMVKGYAGDSQSFMSIASGELMNYAMKIMPREIMKNTVFGPSAEFELISVEMLPEKANLRGVEIPVLFLPDKIRIKIKTRLNHGTTTKMGTASVGLEAMRKSVRELVRKIRQDSLTLSKKGGPELF